MPEEIHVQEMRGHVAADSEVEIVERKGLGHPDTICDLVMERISQALSRAYLSRCGAILHHNCDKGLLVAGQVERRYGGGKVVEPMRLIIGDRATRAAGVDIGEIAIEAARSWFRERFPEIDPDRHVRYQIELKQGSEELADIFRRGDVILSANDTSAAVGYAPLTETETLVLEAEGFFNGTPFKAAHPQTGRDVKVMGVRKDRKLALTVAMPFVDKYVDDEASYFQHREQAREALLAHLAPRLNRIEDVTVDLNTLDRRGAGLSGMYLSVLGTSAEDADSGEVGRGNQVNGIIALNRPRGSEAAAGKNPVSHVGKIYSVLTHVLAGRIHQQVQGIDEVFVWLCSRIGDPIDRPQMASVQVRLAGETKLSAVAEPIREIVRSELSRMPTFCRDLAEGRYAIC
jgi:S-adenosylmethionine synthetase